jgi:hypothetical protein
MATIMRVDGSRDELVPAGDEGELSLKQIQVAVGGRSPAAAPPCLARPVRCARARRFCAQRPRITESRIEASDIAGELLLAMCLIETTQQIPVSRDYRQNIIEVSAGIPFQFTIGVRRRQEGQARAL